MAPSGYCLNDTMRRRFLASLLAMSLPALAQTPVQPQGRPTHGRLERLPTIASRHVDERPVDVWLPDDYAERVARGERFAVVYLHDGQMQFDASTTWNHQDWAIDRAVTSLVAEGRMPPVILVAVWSNGPWRHSEYMPQKFLPQLPAAFRERFVAEALRGKPQSDAYLRFLVEELKPQIDQRYATRPGPAHTAVLGSSMGGLISVYALCEYPQVFGAAAGLSTHWIGIFEPNDELPRAGQAYLREHLPDPATHRLYQDHGTTELDALYPPYQPPVDALVRARGFSDANYLSRVFPGTGHNESAWADRVAIPLEFLFRR
jgi:enterochelin esterase-like enzyme